jgi:hypothetical protein
MVLLSSVDVVLCARIDWSVQVRDLRSLELVSHIETRLKRGDPISANNDVRSSSRAASSSSSSVSSNFWCCCCCCSHVLLRFGPLLSVSSLPLFSQLICECLT